MGDEGCESTSGEDKASTPALLIGEESHFEQDSGVTEDNGSSDEDEERGEAITNNQMKQK